MQSIEKFPPACRSRKKIVGTSLVALQIASPAAESSPSLEYKHRIELYSTRQNQRRSTVVQLSCRGTAKGNRDSWSTVGRSRFRSRPALHQKPGDEPPRRASPMSGLDDHCCQKNWRPQEQEETINGGRRQDRRLITNPSNEHQHRRKSSPCWKPVGIQDYTTKVPLETQQQPGSRWNTGSSRHME